MITVFDSSIIRFSWTERYGSLHSNGLWDCFAFRGTFHVGPITHSIDHLFTSYNRMVLIESMPLLNKAFVVASAMIAAR